MTTDLEALAIAGYVFADKYPVPARRGRPAKVGDAELVALAVCRNRACGLSRHQGEGVIQTTWAGLQ